MLLPNILLLRHPKTQHLYTIINSNTVRNKHTLRKDIQNFVILLKTISLYTLIYNKCVNIRISLLRKVGHLWSFNMYAKSAISSRFLPSYGSANVIIHFRFMLYVIQTISLYERSMIET